MSGCRALDSPDTFDQARLVGVTYQNACATLAIDGVLVELLE